MDGQNRAEIKPGIRVKIVLKADQRTSKLTEGTVKKILTKSSNHPHGIKVMLEDGQVGRVKEILSWGCCKSKKLDEQRPFFLNC